MYFCEKNKKLNNRNLPTKPKSGGIPDKDKNASTIDIDKKLCLFRTFSEFNVLTFFKSNKKSKLNKRHNKYT